MKCRDDCLHTNYDCCRGRDDFFWQVLEANKGTEIRLTMPYRIAKFTGVAPEQDTKPAKKGFEFL